VLIGNSGGLYAAGVPDNGFPLILNFGLPVPAPTATLHVALSLVDWKTLASNAHPKLGAEIPIDGGGDIIFDPVEASDLGCQIVVHAPKESADVMMRPFVQVVAIDDAGKSRPVKRIEYQPNEDQSVETWHFDAAPDDIREVRYLTRPITHTVEVSDISLEPNRLTQPQIKVTELSKKP
jgi:hypothetical protein